MAANGSKEENERDKYFIAWFDAREKRNKLRAELEVVEEIVRQKKDELGAKIGPGKFKYKGEKFVLVEKKKDGKSVFYFRDSAPDSAFQEINQGTQAK